MIDTSFNAQSLQDQFTGAVLDASHTDFDQARKVFYPGYDHQPAVIIRAADEADVARAVTLAREGGLRLSVRSGGHSLAGHGVAHEGIMIDLSALRAMDIDPKSRTAWAQTGLTTGQFGRLAAEHGLAVGFGDTASVGIGGLTLGGGIGYLSRKYGLTIDSLLAADIVTADGQLRRVDADNDPDLFWAIRGGGGNFGVVTRFHFQLLPVDRIVGGMLVLPATAENVYGFVAAADAAPEELTTMANVMVAPPMPFLPEAAQGKPVIMGLMAYVGEETAGLEAVAPFRALDTAYMDTLASMRYVDLFDEEEMEFPAGADVARCIFVDDFDRQAAETVIEYLDKSTAMMRVAQIRALGGAVASVPNDATAYGHRDRKFMMSYAALYNDLSETEQHTAWATDFGQALNGGRPEAYVNFLSDEGPERVRAAYPGGHWERLRAIKQRYDPDNLFRLNQNIPPASAA